MNIIRRACIFTLPMLQGTFQKRSFRGELHRIVDYCKNNIVLPNFQNTALYLYPDEYPPAIPPVTAMENISCNVWSQVIILFEDDIETYIGQCL